MARPSGFYHTIEYIGPRPQKPKRPNFFGGWVILVIAIGMGVWFGKPLVPLVRGFEEKVSSEHAQLLISGMRDSELFGDRLAAAALAHSQENVVYDPAYFKIAYPAGDVPTGKGVGADVLVRCYRRLGIDLQVEVHEDLKANFRQYPQIPQVAAATEPDTNIDHRRVPNLQRFFSRNGQELPKSRNAGEYEPGDIVVWALSNAETHIGIIVPGPGSRMNERWVVHCLDAGVKWENVLFDYEIVGHYRFPVAAQP